MQINNKEKEKYFGKKVEKKNTDIDLPAYLVNMAGPVPLVMDLRITHERRGRKNRWGRITNPSFGEQLHYPNPSDIDWTLTESSDDKTRNYRPDYNNRPSNTISFMSVVASTSGRLHCALVSLLFLQTHRETDRFLTVSGVQLV